MSTSQPLKNKEDIQRLKDYFYNKMEYRNYALITVGLNTALRISDILSMKWEDVYNVEKQDFYTHVYLTEQKTQKDTIIFLNQSVKSALQLYRKTLHSFHQEDYIFHSRKGEQKPISRVQAFRIIKKAVDALGIEEHISCHSLRKTFGYQAWKEGTEPALLMTIFNHSSYAITKRYLCIDQDDKDQLFSKINL
ncbi:MAG: tyrosine-type recombinase/integrase [Lachnospiraceae bacterium]|nr:tyrosine-type recombinase/integrase [Lachnospiraceae bacterium]